MSARRVILVMIEPPLPFGNAAARWFHVLYRGLLARGRQVSAFATCSRPADLEEAEKLYPRSDFDLRIYPEEHERGAFSKLGSMRRPYSYVFGRRFREDLDRELSKGYDVLHLEQHWSGWVGRRHTRRSVLNVHYLVEIDMAEVADDSTIGKLRRIATLDAERRILRAYPRITTLTPRLTERVRGINSRAEVATVPLGLDLALYPFRDRARDSASKPPVLSLIGSFHWPPTLNAAKRLLTRLWPEIKRRVPEARLDIVGRQAGGASRFGEGVDVSYHEDVPDILPYFFNTDVLLYPPTSGSGMKVKILEAFALGTPVVTTAEGVEGLDAADGVHAGISEDDAGLIERAVALLRDPARRAVLARNARSLLERTCGEESTLDAVEAVHERVILGSRAGGMERARG